MGQTTDTESMALLTEIRRIFDDGDHDCALGLLDDYLVLYAEDVEARLLKVELCLEIDEDLAAAAEDLYALSQTMPGYEQVKHLRARLEEKVLERLAAGRRSTGRGYYSDAVESFDQAIALSPGDPAVPLAAAVALLRQGGEEEEEDPPSEVSPTGLLLLWSAHEKSSSPKATEAIERFLRMAMARCTPGASAHNEAVRYLLDHLLRQGQFRDALALLEAAPEAARALPELDVKVSRQSLAGVLDGLLCLLRAGKRREADALLESLSALLPELAALHVVRAESLLQAERQDQALEAYRLALRLSLAPLAEIPLDSVRAALTQVESVRLDCPRCGKGNRLSQAACVYCELPLRAQELLLDRWGGADLPEAVAACAGIAWLLAEREDFTQAVEHLDQALGLLPAGHPSAQALSKLRQQWLGRDEMPWPESSPAAEAVYRWRASGLTPEALAGLRSVCEQAPASWATVPFYERRALARELLESGQLATAAAILGTAFADNPSRKSILSLQARLEQTVAVRREELLRSAREALATRQHSQALAMADNLLALLPSDAQAHLARGQALLLGGQHLSALAAFHIAMMQTDDPTLIRQARLGAARALERSDDFEGALAMVADEEGEEIEQVRACLQRRQRGEPYVMLEQTSTVVMHDTLARADATPFYQGYFAVAVRAVGRPWGSDGSKWTEHILSAGFEFVQVLGGLRNVVGDPVFVLRWISRPDGLLPERGRLTVALLARVSAADVESCHELALHLWETLSSALPLAQEHIYGFEPVTDAAELEALLAPFEPAGIAQAVRLEETPQQAGERYAVYPFTPGSLDLHNLAWVLLRQQAEAMVSIHLLPTYLMPWERTVLDRVMLGEGELVATGQGDVVSVGARDQVAQWWQERPKWGQVQATRLLVDALGSSAYVVHVNVASKDSSLLLPEMAASALFGPLREAGGMRYGGYEVIRASTAEEIERARRNLRTLDVEQWVYSAAPAGMRRLRHMMGEHEAALCFRLPVPGREGVPGMAMLEVKPVAPPATLHVRGTILGDSVTRVAGMPLPIALALDDRRRHIYVVGKTGTGKSTLLKHMALQDIEAGQGVCVIDPHGDLIEDLLARIPPHRMRDVVLFDPADEERPVGLNLLQADSEMAKQRIVNEFIGLLIRMYDPGTMGIVGPRFQHNVRNAMLTAMSVEGGTLIEVVRVLTDMRYVQEILPQVKDPLVRSYWEKQIANTSDFHKSEILDYLVSKFSRFVGDSRIRNIIGQRETTLNFREVMDGRKVLLVNLSKGKIGPESAQFLGLLLVQGLLITALSRADVSPEQRPDFYLYVDEFQNFATDLFSTVFSEGRKYGVVVTAANQYLTQLDSGIREAVFGNVGSIIAFRVGTQDAVALAPEMYPVFGADDLLNLPKFTACVKLLVDGLAARPFIMRTRPDTRMPDPQRAEAIREWSRQTYGRDVVAVQQDVLARFER